MLSLGFSEFSDRRGINLIARTCKTNKAPKVVCQPPLRYLSQTEKIERVNTSVFQQGITPSVAIPSLFMKEEDGPLFMESG